jgi:hypothetical protein
MLTTEKKDQEANKEENILVSVFSNALMLMMKRIGVKDVLAIGY